jgi:predicted RNase H-like nuclease
MAVTRYLGVDLAWREDRGDLPANETGVAVIDLGGQVLDVGWTLAACTRPSPGANDAAGHSDALMFVDASLVVRNESGQRLCETQVGQRYGRRKVSANTTNSQSPRLAGVRLSACGGVTRRGAMRDNETPDTGPALDTPRLRQFRVGWLALSTPGTTYPL